MAGILDTIAQHTHGTSFKTHKVNYDSISYPSINYDDHQDITWKRYGESVHHRKAIYLKELADRVLSNSNPIFKYFLDGSRRTYKVDDIKYDKQVYPIIAGQIGIGCCKRELKRLSKQEYFKQFVLALPRDADKDGWKSELFFNNLLDKINLIPSLQKHHIQFEKILVYDSRKLEDLKLEDKGIAMIQDQMTELEKKMVSDLVSNNLLSQDSYLIKDGSLEYRRAETGNYRELAKIRNNYRNVIGVSKSFNPEHCQDHSGKNNSSAIADLNLFERTPAYMYVSQIVNSPDEQVSFAIWYLRIRDKKYTLSPFDGILKLEKILITDEEISNGLDSDLIDLISANIINERNPVCWGTDSRWANHLYPVFLTETFVKSRFISSNYFLNIF